jgi:chemotaxis protein histidine kinase CheA/CheY-like chemotaxis protein
MITTDNSAEVQLQQELREMFLVDTQQQLETYFDITQRLKPASWIADIQSIYRAIHTIKGGAVTVEANRMLYGAIALEDLLSDLRYLEVAPPLDDGNLSRILLEAGELLASCMEIFDSGNSDDLAAGNRTQLTIQRLQTLHAQVKSEYLPEWNEMKQVHQEFAQQGFDLVVLNLEMELAKIPAQGAVPPDIIETAQATIDQLTHIGAELELDRGWTLLLQRGERLISNPDSQLWRSIWLPYFQILKTCVKNSGEISDAELQKLDVLAIATEVNSNSAISNQKLDLPNNFESNKSLDSKINLAADSPDLLDIFFIDEETFPITKVVKSNNESIAKSNKSLDSKINLAEDSPDLLDIFFIDEEISPMTKVVESNNESIAKSNKSLDSKINLAADLPDLLDIFFIDEETFPITKAVQSSDESIVAINESLKNKINLSEDLTGLLDELDRFDPLAVVASEFVAPTDLVTIAPATLDPNTIATPIATSSVAVKRGISIPVPLERLDRSAQQVVDTLLTARAVMNVSTRLQSQLSQLSVLTQESSQFVTRLRQLQDNYALLRNLSDDRDSSDHVSIERYRQGYITIVRLIENMLRMSELGQEIEATTYQNHSHLEALDRSMIRLKDGIETSRMVPFRNLTLRAKAILRDLTNRYGKPAELIVENEQIELDAGIIQHLEPALLHLLRNAYDHGLETVVQRRAAGKPARGTIYVSLHRRGNLYRLEVEDDGGGIDADAIRQIAKLKGFSVGKTLTNSELLAVLCQPGFSSSSTVSEVSGRGVGMDVVVTQIASIGGKLSLETSVGRGTKLTIEVPAPQLLVPCVLLQVGERTVAFPTEEVLETALLSSLAAKMSADDNIGMCAWTLTTSRGDVSGFDLANYWQLTHRSLADTAVCIRTRQGADGTEIWSIADDLLGQAELLIKPLPSPLIAPVGLLGVSLHSDGRLISILDPIALTTKLAASAEHRFADKSFSTIAVDRARPSAPTILIVDDAALMRRRFEVCLNTYGFITHTCTDGLEALNWLQTNPLPDLMITDVEMPNLDGFTLIDRTRQALIEIPILVVSSRSSEEWRKEARRLGASDYLSKGFATAELIQKVNSLLGLMVNV